MPAKMKDIYSNRTYAQVVMSAANTLTFEQIRFAAGTFEGIALIINKLKYYLDGTTVRALQAATDSVTFGLTNRNDMTSIEATSLSVIDKKDYIGTGAAVEPVLLPFVSDFTNLPGGGLLVATNPLYLGVISAGLVAVVTLRLVIEYQWKKLSDKESIELLQTMIPGNV